MNAAGSMSGGDVRTSLHICWSMLDANGHCSTLVPIFHDLPLRRAPHRRTYDNTTPLLAGIPFVMIVTGAGSNILNIARNTLHQPEDVPYSKPKPWPFTLDDKYHDDHRLLRSVSQSHGLRRHSICPTRRQLIRCRQRPLPRLHDSMVSVLPRALSAESRLSTVRSQTSCLRPSKLPGSTFETWNSRKPSSTA